MMNDMDVVRFIDLEISSSVKALAEDAARRLTIYKQMQDATPEHIFALEFENRGRMQAVIILYSKLKGNLNLLTDLEKLYVDTYNEWIKVFTSQKKYVIINTNGGYKHDRRRFEEI